MEYVLFPPFLCGERLTWKLKGRYVPVFAAAVYDQNAMLTAAGITPINLQSIMIGNYWYQKQCFINLSHVPCAGNGLTDFYTMSAAYVEMQCTGASVFPVQTISYVTYDIDIY
jgi:hypothetical protein